MAINFGQTFGNVGSTASAFSSRMDRSFLGRALKRGAAESFGWSYAGDKSLGFLGLGNKPIRRLGNLPRITSRIAQRQGAGKAAAFAGSRLLPGIGLGITAYMMYQGYKEGGVLGAAQEGAISVAASAAWTVGAKALTSGMLGVGLGVAAVGYGTFRVGEAAQEYRKNLRKVEMGGMHDIINTQGAYTDRARALQAIQGSHLNHRSAIGQEAQLLHVR